MPDPYADLRQFVDALRGEHLDWRSKGFGALPRPLSARELGAGGVRLSELGTPMMTIDAEAVRHNVAAMAGWCTDRRLGLAPHGKTTMAPALWLAQLDGGARAASGRGRAPKPLLCQSRRSLRSPSTNWRRSA